MDISTNSTGSDDDNVVGTWRILAHFSQPRVAGTSASVAVFSMSMRVPFIYNSRLLRASPRGQNWRGTLPYQQFMSVENALRLQIAHAID